MEDDLLFGRALDDFGHRPNWMFRWTEIGAKYVGIIQSLISTCRVHGIDPYTYLVDVLQRIDTHLVLALRSMGPLFLTSFPPLSPGVTV